MKPSPLETAMQRAWDEGRDPFDDERVLAAIDDDPEGLEQAARWRRSVLTLQRPQPLPAARARRLVPAALLAAAAVLALWFGFADAKPTETEATATPTLRVRHTSVERRVQHHGSARAVRRSFVEATAPPTNDRPHDPRLVSRLVQITETPLTR